MGRGREKRPVWEGFWWKWNRIEDGWQGGSGCRCLTMEWNGWGRVTADLDAETEGRRGAGSGGFQGTAAVSQRSFRWSERSERGQGCRKAAVER